MVPGSLYRIAVALSAKDERLFRSHMWTRRTEFTETVNNIVDHRASNAAESTTSFIVSCGQTAGVVECALLYVRGKRGLTSPP
jgi:hypothetical protein